MKIIIIATLLAVAATDPVIRSLTLKELSTALETKQLEPSDRRAFMYALNKIMNVTFSGINQESVQAAIPSPSGTLEWTLSEMNDTIMDPSTDVQTRLFVKMARDTMREMNAHGMNRKSMAITLPALDISTWTREDLDEVIDDPNTIPALRRRLKKALNDLDKANASGKKQDTIKLVTAVGIIPNKNPRFLPAPKLNYDSQSK